MQYLAATFLASVAGCDLAAAQIARSVGAFVSALAPAAVLRVTALRRDLQSAAEDDDQLPEALADHGIAPSLFAAGTCGLILMHCTSSPPSGLRVVETYSVMRLPTQDST